MSSGKLKEDENLKSSGAYDERHAWKRWNSIAIFITAAVAVLGAIALYPAHTLIVEGFYEGSGSFSQRLSDVGTFFGHAGQVLLGQINPIVFLKEYFGRWAATTWDEANRLPHVWMLWIGLTIIVGASGISLNPHRRTPNIFGDTRYASDKDLEQMEQRDLVGFDKKLFVVGRWKDKLLKMGETLSVLLLAPPGTGKSVGFIVPTIVTADDSSLFIHDQKPELFDMTSNHRATLGPVYQLKWAAQDEPDGRWVSGDEEKLMSPDLLIRNNDGSLYRDPSTEEAKTKPIYYPSWNPLSPLSIPPAGPKRDMYIDRLVNVLAPDPQSGDKFWTSKARAALTGLIHFLVVKVECAMDPDFDGGSWDGIPTQWIGQEASFPMLVDWFAYAQNENDDPEAEDPMRAMFRAAVDEAKTLNEKYYQKHGVRPMNRAIVELTSLQNSPDKTRGSILTTMDESLTPFKNEAVRQRTSASDFAFNTLRGVPTPEAKEREMKRKAEAEANGKRYKTQYAPDEWRPITIYISVNLEDAKALAVITAIFCDAANSYLVANGPNAIDDQGNQIGPYSFGFLLDEAPQLPKLDTVINGPSVGRSKKVWYCIVGQDYGQFEQKYSKPEVETLKSTTALKAILSQNNETTAKAVSESAGKTTYTKQNISDGEKKKGLQTAGLLGDLLEYKKKSSSESFEGTEFIKSSFVMSLPPGKHLVQVQNFMNRPILCDTPKFFEDKELKKLVFNLRDLTGPIPAPPMPKADMAAAADRKMRAKEGEEQASADLAAAKSTRHVLVATPRDIQALTRDPSGNVQDKGDLYACWVGEIDEDTEWLEIPEDADVFVTNDLTEITSMIGNDRIVCFDEETLQQEINAYLEDMGHKPIPKSRLTSIAEMARRVDEEPGEDICKLGWEGAAGLDLPESSDQVTPQFALYWMAETMTFLLGIRAQTRLFERFAESDGKPGADTAV